MRTCALLAVAGVVVGLLASTAAHGQAVHEALRLEAGASAWASGAPLAGPVETVDSLEARQAFRSRWALGAGMGFVVGAGATYFVLWSGDSTSLCDRSANQDAIRGRECAGLVVAGGLVGAGVGALVGRRFRSERGDALPLEHVRVGPSAVGGVGIGMRLRF